MGLISQIEIPESVGDYLRPSNARLEELRQRYKDHPASFHSLWSQRYLATELNLDRFRADNVYVHQRRSASDLSYRLTAAYVKSVDKLQLLQTLADDELFGNYQVSCNGNRVSRDLLDSVLEVNFLNEKLGPTFLNHSVILDIGAGYGRLAHRLVQAIPQLETVLCTDAIPESTFLSEFYLKFRGCDTKAKVIPLDEIEIELRRRPVDIAINVHSFGECPLRSIEWWLDLVSDNQIKYLFIVPNGEALTSWESNNTHVDYLPALRDRGYKIMVKEPNYRAPSSLQKLGLYPCYYYLFKRD